MFGNEGEGLLHACISSFSVFHPNCLNCTAWVVTACCNIYYNYFSISFHLYIALFRHLEIVQIVICQLSFIKSNDLPSPCKTQSHKTLSHQLTLFGLLHVSVFLATILFFPMPIRRSLLPSKNVSIVIMVVIRTLIMQAYISK